MNLDVMNFIPWRDIPKDNTAKRAMIRQSINPYDARKWIEDCCQAERLIGRKDSSGDWTPWREKDEYSFAELSAAYVSWQATVRSPVAPLPTPLGNLGEVLNHAGFGSARQPGTRGRKRYLPDPQVCLEALWNTPSTGDVSKALVCDGPCDRVSRPGVSRHKVLFLSDIIRCDTPTSISQFENK